MVLIIFATKFIPSLILSVLRVSVDKLGINEGVFNLLWEWLSWLGEIIFRFVPCEPLLESMESVKIFIFSLTSFTRLKDPVIPR